MTGSRREFGFERRSGLMVTLRRHRGVAFAMLGAVLQLLACEGWEDWDTPFRRRYAGWQSSDGGSTVRLPGIDGILGNADDQVLWVFGDSLLNPSGPLNLIGGNTVAVGPLKNPVYTPPTAPDEGGGCPPTCPPSNPPATELKFYARKRDGAWPPGQVGDAIDITWSATATDLINFFRRSCSDNTAHSENLLYPGHGIYHSTNELVFFTHEIGTYTPPNSTVPTFYLNNTHVQRYGNISDPDGPVDWECLDPTTLGSQYNKTCATANDCISSGFGDTCSAGFCACDGDNDCGTSHCSGGFCAPTEAMVAADPPLVWGVAVIKSPVSVNVYVFGTRQEGGLGGTLFAPDAKLARITSTGNLFNYSTWQFYYKASTQGCGSSGPCWRTVVPDTVQKRNDLHTVAAAVAPELSVEPVTWTESGPNGTFTGTRWIMLHGYLTSLRKPDGNSYVPPDIEPPHFMAFDYAANFRGIAMRSAFNPWKFPPPGGTVTDGSEISSTTMRDYIFWGTPGGAYQVDRKVITGFNGYRNIHAVKGHALISEPGIVYVSYNVWRKWGCDPLATSTCDPLNQSFDLWYTEADSSDPALKKSAFRFTKAPLNRVYPWCQAYDGYCIPYP